MPIGVGPVKQAFVRALRSIAGLKSAVGSDGFYEGIALPGASYPYVIYSVAGAFRSRQFGVEGILKVTIDCWVVSGDQVEAHNLDQLVLAGLEDAILDFTGTVPAPSDEPSTLLCHRVQDMSLTDLDDAGNKVYQVGGSYHVWIDRL